MIDRSGSLRSRTLEPRSGVAAGSVRLFARSTRQRRSPFLGRPIAHPERTPVGDIMSRNLVMVGADETLDAAAATMRRREIGFLPVRDLGERPIGVVTDRDLVVRGIAADLDPTTARVRQVMTAGVFAVPADAEVSAAVALMSARQIRRAIVVDDRRRAIGVIALCDLVDRLPGTGHELAAAVLQNVVRP